MTDEWFGFFCSVADALDPRAQAFRDMDELSAEFAAYCGEHGADAPPRLLELAAAFTWLKLNPDDAPEAPN